MSTPLGRPILRRARLFTPMDTPMRSTPFLLPLVLLACGGTPTSAPTPSTSATSAGRATAPSDPASTVEVRSGVSVGPVVIGTRREDVERLGLPVRPHPSGQMGDDVRMVGPYYVVFTAGKVSSVQITPAAAHVSLRIGGHTFAPTAGPAEIAAALPGCGPENPGTGGSQRTCDGGKTLVKLGPSCVDEAPNGACRHFDGTRPHVSVQVIVP